MEKLPIRVLLVEDNPADVLFLREALEQDALAVYDLTVVESLAEALDSLKKQKFEAILLDLGLPDSQGLPTFLQLHQAAPELPVVVLSALDDEDVARQALQMGAQDYLVKRPQEIVAAARAIRYAIERQNLNRSIQESEQRFAAAFHASPACQLVTTLPDGLILDVNEAFCRLLGYERAELLNFTTREIEIWADAQEREAAFQAFHAEGRISNREVVYRTRSGELRTVLASVEPIEIRGLPCVISTSVDITERKQAEQALRASERKLRLISENTTDFIFAYDLERRLFYANPAIEKLTGYTLDELQEQNFINWLHPEDEARMMKLLDDVFEGRGFSGEEFRIVTKDGRVKLSLSSWSPMFDETGRQIGVQGRETDITARKQAEVELHESEAKYRLLVETSKEGIWSMDREHLTTYVNQAMADMLGYEPVEMLGRKVEEFFFAEDMGFHRERMQQRHAGQDEIYERRFQCRDGSVLWTQVSARVLKDAQGNFNGSFAMFTDITERKQAQAALAESEQRLRLALETTSDGFWIVDTERRFREVNPAYCAMSGYTREEVLQMRIQDVDVLESAEDTQTRVEKIQQKGSDRFETKHRRKDGSFFDIEVSVNVLDMASGQMICFCRDITERKQAEFALREGEEKYRQLSIELEERVQRRTAEIEAVRQRLELATQAASLGVWDWDVKTGQLYWDDQMYAIYGLPKDTFQVTMESFLSIVYPEDLPNLTNSTQEALAGEPFGDVEFRIVRGDRTLGHVKVHGVIRRNAAGQAEDVIGVVQDITQEKLAEQALRASEAQLRLSRDKLSAANAALEKAARMKDEFLASMSHELRTPLTGILGLSEALQLNTYGSLTEKQARALKNIEDSGRHLLSLINDILDLSKIESGMFELNIEPVSISEVCQASLQLTKGLAQKKRQTVEFSMSPASIHLLSDARRLKQMLVNLLSNAIKFTPANGSLGLEVLTDEAEQVIELTVWDKGIGIAPENIEKLFQPFVQLESSLARQYEGTGLGLSLVQRLTELHGGSVQVESTLGQGSRFTIRLPWSSHVTPAALNAPSEARLLQKVLIVDDSEIDAGQLSRYLRIFGLETILHTMGQGVVEVAAREQPGVILLDLNLPGQHGFAALAELKADPATSGIPVVICSVEEQRSQALAQGAVGYLVKPLTITELRHELTRVSAALKQGSAAALDAESSQPLILVVDDNELIIETIIEFLVSQQYRVAAARSGIELLEVVSDLHPALILMDIQMPIMDGLEATRRIRSHPDPLVSTVPIIALTALAMTGDRERCLAAGTTAYMSKPVGLKPLTETIHNLLAEKE